jgi:glycerol-3-phosphate dehydrogenase (NAD(P)+)
MNRILLVGFGMFGQGLAYALSKRDGISITVFVRSARDLPDYIENMCIVGGPMDLSQFDAILLALPSFAIEEVLQSLMQDGEILPPIISCTKGMHPLTAEFTSQVIYRVTKSDRIGVLLGASFADEMLSGKAVQLTLACANLQLGDELASLLRTETLKIGTSSDIRGLEVISVTKNILAIGAGMVTALGLGESFRAAYIAKGINETANIIAHLGGSESSIFDLGALGDVILTCSSSKSRNFQCGMRLVDLQSMSGQLAEGSHSARLFCQKLQSFGLRSRFFETVASAMEDPAEILKVFN